MNARTEKMTCFSPMLRGENSTNAEKTLNHHVVIKGSLDEKLPSYEVLKMLRE